MVIKNYQMVIRGINSGSPITREWRDSRRAINLFFLMPSVILLS